MSLIVAAMAISGLAPSSAYAVQDGASLANLKIDSTNLLSKWARKGKRRAN
jgi:hypothetical protein